MSAIKVYVKSVRTNIHQEVITISMLTVQTLLHVTYNQLFSFGVFDFLLFCSRTGIVSWGVVLV